MPACRRCSQLPELVAEQDLCQHDIAYLVSNSYHIPGNCCQVYGLPARPTEIAAYLIWRKSTQFYMGKVQYHPARCTLVVKEAEYSDCHQVHCSHCFQLQYEMCQDLGLQHKDAYGNVRLGPCYDCLFGECGNDALCGCQCHSRAMNCFMRSTGYDGHVFVYVCEPSEWASNDNFTYTHHCLFRSCDELVDQDPILAAREHIKNSVCFRFFKSNCNLCGYQAAPAPDGSHCIGCYYFVNVLNELMGSLTLRDCEPQCLDRDVNQVKQWPRSRVKTRCLERTREEWAAIIDCEREAVYQEELAIAKASWITHLQ